MNPRPILPVVLVLVGGLCGCPGEQAPQNTPRRTVPQRPPVPGWPPAKGARYHDLLLRDLEGNEVHLESLAGTPILLQLVCAQLDVCVAYTAGSDAEPFRGTAPYPGVRASDERMAEHSLSRDSPHLLRVHVLFFDDHLAPGSLEVARAWDAHFGLSERANTHVFVADPRYANGDTYRLIPGYHLIDRDFTFVSNGVLNGGDPLGEHTLSMALRLAEEHRLSEPPPFPEDQLDPPANPVPHRFASFAGFLEAGDFAGLDAELEARVATRRPRGHHEDWLLAALETLSKYPLGVVRAWTEARPESAFAWTVAGARHIHEAWAARGSGWANSVTEEQWAAFHEHLRLSAAALERALALRDDLPHPYYWLLIVDKGLGADKATTRAHVDAAREIDPTFVEAYTNYLDYLQPRWHGSNEELLAFAAEARRAHPDEAAMAYVEYRALNYVISEEVVRQRAASSWLDYVRARPELRSKLEELLLETLEAYPQAIPSLNQLLALSEVPEPRDDAQWLRATRALCEEDVPSALLNLGVATWRGERGLAEDPRAGAALVMRAARAGDTDAASRVAFCFERSTAPGTDERARRWYAYAARLGHRGSIRVLGVMTLEGRGGPADADEGRRLLERAAQAGDAKATELLEQFR
ncbi:MAG: DUF4034 domain-containing protein [Planctomycetota bacterium]